MAHLASSDAADVNFVRVIDGRQLTRGVFDVINVGRCAAWALPGVGAKRRKSNLAGNAGSGACLPLGFHVLVQPLLSTVAPVAALFETSEACGGIKHVVAIDPNGACTNLEG
jgi:hypothetical protein